MNEATLLYRAVVTERGRTPRFRGFAFSPARASAHRETAANPVCGDELTLELTCADDALAMRFDGHACLVCLASADLLAESVDSASVAEARRTTARFLAALDSGATEGLSPALVSLLGVRALPIRVACAKLPWDAATKALAAIAADPLSAESAR